MPRLRRVTACATVTLALLFAAYWAGRPPDSEQAAIVSTEPADGATFAEAPTAVELTFTAPLDRDRSHVFVWDESGTASNRGQPRLVSPERLYQPVNITTAGAVTVAYHVTFVDGAELAGTLRFRALARAAAATGATNPPSAFDINDAVAGPTHQHGVDPISAALLALDGIAMLVVIVLLMRRPHPVQSGTRRLGPRQDALCDPS